MNVPYIDNLILKFYSRFFPPLITNTINEKKCSMVANETTIHPSRNILKVTNYRSKYGLQHGGIFKGPKITSVKQLKQNTKRSSLYKKNEKQL